VLNVSVWEIFAMYSKKIIPAQKDFLDFEKDPSQFLNFLALEGLVFNKKVVYEV